MPDLKELQDKVFKQEDAIATLGEKHHELELEVCKIMGKMTKVDESQTELKKNISKHITKEESAVTGIHERINSMDSELKESFKTRDGEITNLKISQAKMLAYATAIFVIINIIIQVIIP